MVFAFHDDFEISDHAFVFVIYLIDFSKMEMLAVFRDYHANFLPFIVFRRVVATPIELYLVQVGTEVFMIISEDLLNSYLLG